MALVASSSLLGMQLSGLRPSSWRGSSFRSLQCKCNAQQDLDTQQEKEEEARAIAQLARYVELNSGSWRGTFTQYDLSGNVLACIPVRMKGNVYGKGEHASLLQTLWVKQAKSSTFVAGDEEEPQWIDFTLEEHDLVTLERRHNVGYFPDDKAYCLSYITASIPDAVLRTGLLGENDNEDRDVFSDIKLPCRRPALVNESCLFSDDGNSRVRAFHVLNSQGFLDTIGVFREHREQSDEAHTKDSSSRRMDSLAGEWTGQAMTRRTGLYGSTTADERVLVGFEEKEERKLVQKVTTISDTRATTELVLNGEIQGNLITFSEGLQTILLPGGMFLTCPVSVGACVKHFYSFCLEFGWVDTANNRRRRLTRTYDTSGAVVSTTFSKETRT